MKIMFKVASQSNLILLNVRFSVRIKGSFASFLPKRKEGGDFY